MKRDKTRGAAGAPTVRSAWRDDVRGRKAERPKKLWAQAPRAFAAPQKAPASPAPASPAPQTRVDAVALYGFHTVREALRAGKRKFIRLFATEAAAQKLAGEIAAAGLSAQLATSEELSRRLGGAVHQGVLLEALAFEPLDVSEIATQSGVVLVLDQITDPHNVGAIARAAAAFRVDALIMTERHAPGLAGALAKAASGGLEHLSIVHVVNLARALRELQAMGYLCVGLDSEGEADLEETPLGRPLALVLGGEGKGLRRLTRENCDVIARLDLPGAIRSLNVSNACAVALSVIRRRLGA